MNDSPYAQSVRYVDEFADGDDQFANDAVPAGPLFHLAQGGSPMTAEERLRLLQRGGQAPPPPQQPPPRAAPPAARQAPATDPAIREFDDRKRECIAQYPYN